MRRLIVAVFVLCLVAVVVSAASPPLPKGPQALVKRGEYVAGIAGCADCHSARDQKGEFIKERWMQGTALSFKPAVPMPVWADKAVNIAGLPGWTDEQAIKFLMTGIAYNDLPPRPPMPQYKMNREDATAVVAYLRSLKPATPAAATKPAGKAATK